MVLMRDGVIQGELVEEMGPAIKGVMVKKRGILQLNILQWQEKQWSADLLNTRNQRLPLR